jgi:hypothetical protein
LYQPILLIKVFVSEAVRGRPPPSPELVTYP